MTLSERVLRAEQLAPVQDGGSTRLFLRLRSFVQGRISADELARMMSVSPLRARSEVRRACLDAFDDPFWNEVGLRERDDLVKQVIDNVFGFGPLEGLLSDPEVTEVIVNGPSKIFYEKGGVLWPSDQSFANEEQLRALVDRILGPLGRRVDEQSPLVNARLPQGHRMNVVIPPLAPDGTAVTIRKFTERVLSLDDLLHMGSFDQTVKTVLEWSVLSRKNLAVSGGTGSGKTTLLNALSCVIPPGERIITIEDSAELRFLEHPHVVRLEARPRNAEGVGQVSIRDLVINALRMRPDRIVVGECRGEEALDMLTSMQTGHDGSLTTLHANSPDEVTTRLATMVRYAADLPVDVIEENVAQAIDVIVQTARAADGSRYVSHIAQIGFDRSLRRSVTDTLFYRSPLEREGHWLDVPGWIDHLPEMGVASVEEVDQWMSCLSLK